MSTLNPQTAGDWGSFLAGLVAVLTVIATGFTFIFITPFKIFLTIKSADKTFLKISNQDGTRNYVHPTELIAINGKLDKIIEHLNIQ